MNANLTQGAMVNIKGMKHGDVTAWATKVLHDSLEAVINSKASRREPYFILVIIKDGYFGPAVSNSGHDMKTVDMSHQKVVTNRLVIMDRAPLVPMIGTSLWRIDNKTGEVRCIYILPPDRPMVEGFTVGEDSASVAKCAKGMPIIYGAEG